jgi:GNAT superfamily N-acetyltransferase
MHVRTLLVDGRSLSVGPATVQQILPLRHRVLRIGLSVESAKFPGDGDATTLHAAVFEQATVISCATLMLNEYGGRSAWQLRGMATDDAWQSRGIGAALLQYLTEWALAGPDVSNRINSFWCNARVPAIPFYQRLGWIVDSEEFDIPTAGPHRRMVRQIQLLERP